MTLTQDYLNDLLIRQSYHSSGIEGNTITLAETMTIILEHATPGGHRSIREFFEIENHRAAFRRLVQALDDQEPLTLSLICSLQGLLTDRLQHDSGRFKQSQSPNAIVGADFQTASPAETPQLMRQWADNTAWQLDHADDEEARLLILAQSHLAFERIHPFSDGNGRTGRLLVVFLAMRYLGAAVIVPKEERPRYLQALADQNEADLTDLFRASLAYERDRMGLFRA